VTALEILACPPVIRITKVNITGRLEIPLGVPKLKCLIVYWLIFYNCEQLK